jgi:hypothetical protein
MISSSVRKRPSDSIQSISVSRSPSVEGLNSLAVSVDGPSTPAQSKVVIAIPGLVFSGSLDGCAPILPKKRTSSAVGFPAMAHRSDFEGVVAFQIEEHAVVAAAETEADERGFSFFTSPVRLTR